MSVDYDPNVGVGFDTGCDYINHAKVIEVLELKAKKLGIEDDILGYIYDLQGVGFEIKPYGSYCYSGDEDDLRFLIVKENYKDNDVDFVIAVNGFFNLNLSADLIDLVAGVWVS